MRLMQHMFPLLLTNLPEMVAVEQHPAVPDGAVLMKSFDPVGAIIGGAAAVFGSVTTLITNPANNRTAQEIARQATMQAEINATSAADARAAQLQMLKYVVPAGLIGLTLYLILR